MANVDCMMGRRVAKIVPQDKTIILAEGQNLAYDKLVLCTGARPRELPIEGADLPNVFYLRNADDVLAIKAKVAAGKKR